MHFITSFRKITSLITTIFTMVSIQLDNAIHKCIMICMVNYVKIIWITNKVHGWRILSFNTKYLLNSFGWAHPTSNQTTMWLDIKISNILKMKQLRENLAAHILASKLNYSLPCNCHYFPFSLLHTHRTNLGVLIFYCFSSLSYFPF